MCLNITHQGQGSGNVPLALNFAYALNRTADTEPAAPQLDGSYYKISGNRTKTKVVSQTVQVSGEEGDSFVLAGWAKGYAARLEKLQDRGRSCVLTSPLANSATSND